jgi:hypothetical protein
MSRKLFIVVVVGVLVLATLVAPAVATPLNGHDVALGQTEVGPALGSFSPLFPLSIQLSGGSECGGAGGCPV